MDEPRPTRLIDELSQHLLFVANHAKTYRNRELYDALRTGRFETILALCERASRVEDVTQAQIFAIAYANLREIHEKITQTGYIPNEVLELRPARPMSVRW